MKFDLGPQPSTSENLNQGMSSTKKKKKKNSRQIQLTKFYQD